MSSVIGQIIVDAQRMANRIKDLDTLGSGLLLEADGNNRILESLRQFQSDVDSLNSISNNKSNVEMVNRIQQQNANSSEILKENRELKICIEDYERAMELIMQKYREHTNTSILESKVNFRDVYNDKLWKIIREQRVKINEMAAVMQRAATIDDDAFNREMEIMTNLRLENKTLRELLHCGGSTSYKDREFILAEKAIQTDAADESPSTTTDDLSLSGISIENVNNSVLLLNNNSNHDNEHNYHHFLHSPNDEINNITVIVKEANLTRQQTKSDAPASAAPVEGSNKDVNDVNSDEQNDVKMVDADNVMTTGTAITTPPSLLDTAAKDIQPTAT